MEMYYWYKFQADNPQKSSDIIISNLQSGL